MILLVTDKKDVHPSPVLKHLEDWKYPIFRLNTDALLTDYEFGWSISNGKSDFFIKNNKTHLTVRGDQIHSVWERRPSSPSQLLVNPENEIVEKFIIDEARGFVFDLRHFLADRYCIGHPLFDCHSDSKMWQLKIARDLGFKIPSTVIANHKKSFIDFAHDNESLLIKPINSDSAADYDSSTEKVFYSRKISRQQIFSAEEDSFSQTASCIQEYIPKQYELRVTVVHDQIFACKIDSQAQGEEEGKIDWRQGCDLGLKYCIVEVPGFVRTFCLEYLKRMHLNFGCFDFILTPGNEYVFLECNPNGQWLWIEHETGLAISKGIARILMHADKGLLTYNNNACY